VKACRVPSTVRRFYWNTSRAICCPPRLHLRPRGRLCICAIISIHSTEIYTHAAATNKRASELPAAQVQLMSCLYQNVTSVLHTHYCHHHSLDTVTVDTAKGCLSTNSTCKAALQIWFRFIHHRRLDNKRKKWPTRGLRRPVANCTESRRKKTRYISVSKGVISWFSRNLWKSDKFVLNKWINVCIYYCHLFVSREQRY
jgi:hypothetical protein